MVFHCISRLFMTFGCGSNMKRAWQVLEEVARMKLELKKKDAELAEVRIDMLKP